MDIANAEKTPMQKIVTEWIFQQSAGIVMSLLTITICLYFSNNQAKEIQNLRTELRENALYQRQIFEVIVKENTRALENFKMFQEGRSSIKKM